MSYRSSRADARAANEHPCPNCATPVYWRDGPYCYSCKTLPIRQCPACSGVSQTDRGQCLVCHAPLPKAPIFGLDRIPEPKQRWTTRDPAVLAEAAYLRWIKGAKGDPSISLAVCDGCGEPFGYSTDKRPVVGAIYGSGYGMAESYVRDQERRAHDIARYRIPVPDDPGHWTYGGNAHVTCVDNEGWLIKPTPPWPGYTPEAQAYEIATR